MRQKNQEFPLTILVNTRNIFMTMTPLKMTIGTQKKYSYSQNFLHTGRRRSARDWPSEMQMKQ